MNFLANYGTNKLIRNLEMHYLGDIDPCLGSSDEILIGSNHLPQNSIDSPGSEMDFNPNKPIENNHFSQIKDTNFVDRLLTNIYKTIVILMLLVGTTYIFKSLPNNGNNVVYLLSNSTILIVGVYFSIFFLVSFLLLRRKKINLAVRGGFLHIKSFPSLYHKIPINQILNCQINTFCHGNLDSNNLQLFLSKENNSFTADLQSGILVQLISGKKIVFGSSESFPFQLN